MAETAALLADEVFPDVPLRQWVISLTQSTRFARGAGSPFPLRYLFAAHPQARANGFSLHAVVSCEGNQKDKRERLCTR